MIGTLINLCYYYIDTTNRLEVFTMTKDEDKTLEKIINKVTDPISKVSSASVRNKVGATALGALGMIGGLNGASGQDVETFNTAKTGDGAKIEQVTILEEDVENKYIDGVMVGTSILTNGDNPKITTTGNLQFDSDTDLYVFTEHDTERGENSVELKVNQELGPHVVGVGFSPEDGEEYAGFRANYFKDQGFGAHIKQDAEGDIDLGGNIYKLWDENVFTGVRKENDNVISVVGIPSNEGFASRLANIYGVEQNDAFMQTELFLTSDSEPTYYGENKFNQIAWSTGDQVVGDSPQTMSNGPHRYVFPPKMFLSDGTPGSVTHTKIGDQHSLDVEAFTDLEELGYENVLVGGHASADVNDKSLDRLGVDIGYNGDDINASVSVSSGPDGEPVGEVTFHYKP